MVAGSMDSTARCGRRRALPPLAHHPLQAEASDVFFSVTKLFQHRDVHLRRMVYLVIKEIIPSSDEVIIITSRWMGGATHWLGCGSVGAAGRRSLWAHDPTFAVPRLAARSPAPPPHPPTPPPHPPHTPPHPAA